MDTENKSKCIISILIPLVIGSLSALIGDASAYQTLNKPAASPPSVVFPIVWTILYILMGISSYMIYMSDDPGKNKALKTYAIQLMFNFCWSIIFFRFTLYLPAFLWILALIGVILVMIVRFYRIKPVSAYLQIPYLLWCVFAAYLNFMIYIMN